MPAVSQALCWEQEPLGVFHVPHNAPPPHLVQTMQYIAALVRSDSSGRSGSAQSLRRRLKLLSLCPFLFCTCYIPLHRGKRPLGHCRLIRTGQRARRGTETCGLVGIDFLEVLLLYNSIEKTVSCIGYRFYLGWILC